MQWILKKAPILIESMVEVAQARRWTQTIVSVLEFSQHLMQGLSHKDSCLLQLPHFTTAEVKHCASGKGKHAGYVDESL